jgi:hypothetical protein
VGGFVAAWAVGEGIIIYRAVSKNHAPPMPGALLWSSALFVMLALVAESEAARPLATTLAWGFDIAALLNLFPTVTGGGTSTAPATQPAPSTGVQAL